MARSKEFDIEVALDAAVEVFREHGFAGSSTQMLTTTMKIGKQSLYDTFDGKWQLYCSALKKYGASETAAHIALLRGSPRAMEGLEKMLERVVAQANCPCLGIGSIVEFGSNEEDLNQIREPSGRALRNELVKSICEAKNVGDLSNDLDPDYAAGFLLANVAAIRIAARGGASQAELIALSHLTLKALK